LTNQEIFEKAITALLEQGRPSISQVDTGGEYQATICAYRGQDGCKCAIGHLIADEVYSDYLEGKGVDHSDVVKALRDSDIPMPDYPTILFDLQQIHDNAYRQLSSPTPVPFVEALWQNVEYMVAMYPQYNLNTKFLEALQNA
jgi:hypothetical protein